MMRGFMTYFFTADTHFGSDEILTCENRPFPTMETFRKFVIDSWNTDAGEDDIIYHLGDFISYNQIDKDTWLKGLLLVQQFHSKIVLIIGNNEERIISEHFAENFEDFRAYCMELGFHDVCKDFHLTIDDTKFYLNHYPRNHKDGYVNLFGHTHRATGLWKPYGLNMGCDLNHFRLFSVAEIKRLLKDKELYLDTDPDAWSM